MGHKGLFRLSSVEKEEIMGETFSKKILDKGFLGYGDEGEPCLLGRGNRVKSKQSSEQSSKVTHISKGSSTGPHPGCGSDGD